MRGLPLLLLLLAMPAHAQDPPACTPAREGQLACMAGTSCQCRFERGGSLTGRPDRFAWDCGALRPACPPEPAVLAPQPVPEVGVLVGPRR